MTEQSDAWLAASLKPENWERDLPVEVCCDRCWPPECLANASHDDLTEPGAWQLTPVTRLGSKHARDRAGPTRRATRKMLKDIPGRRRTDRPRQRGVTLRCRRCKRERNHSLRRIYSLAEAAEAAGEHRIFP